MEEKVLIIRIAKLKQSLKHSMHQHLPAETVQKIEHRAIESRVERWFTELHRREVNRRAILKGLILPGNRAKTRVQNIHDVVEQQQQKIEKRESTSEPKAQQTKETNQLIQELFSAEDTTAEEIPEPFDTPSQAEVDVQVHDSMEPDTKLAEDEEESVEDSIPLLIPQAPKRRATQKKMLRSRTPIKSEPMPQETHPKEEGSNILSQQEDEKPSIEPEGVQVQTTTGIESFSVIQDPELQLTPLPNRIEETVPLTLEELCDGLDENPNNIEMRMMRAVHYEREKKWVLALSDFRKAAEQHHAPAWDEYIRLLLQCNLKVRAAEAEARKERI